MQQRLAQRLALQHFAAVHLKRHITAWRQLSTATRTARALQQRRNAEALAEAIAHWQCYRDASKRKRLKAARADAHFAAQALHRVFFAIHAWKVHSQQARHQSISLFYAKRQRRCRGLFHTWRLYVERKCVLRTKAAKLRNSKLYNSLQRHFLAWKGVRQRRRRLTARHRQVKEALGRLATLNAWRKWHRALQQRSAVRRLAATGMLRLLRGAMQQWQWRIETQSRGEEVVMKLFHIRRTLLLRQAVEEWAHMSAVVGCARRTAASFKLQVRLTAPFHHVPLAMVYPPSLLSPCSTGGGIFKAIGG